MTPTQLNLIRLVFLNLLMVLLVACNKSASPNLTPRENNQIIIGASTTPHAQILEFIKPILAKDGIELKIVIFRDYVLPNLALMEDELDANYFQHQPFLDKSLADNPGWDLVSVGAVHTHPYRFYSKKYQKLADLPPRATIVSSSNISQHGHILSIFQAEGLIKLRAGIDVEQATLADIVENPRNLNFNFSIDAPLVPQVYKNNEADVAMIDGHFAANAGMDLTHEVIFAEQAANSIYANIVVVRKKNRHNPKIKRLMQVLTSPATKQFIREQYAGNAMPV